MTRAEFDSWIEQHYTELLKVARRRTNSDEDAADATQNALASMLGSSPFMSAPIAYAWPRAVRFVTSEARNLRRGSERGGALKSAVKSANSAGRLHGWKRPAPRAE